jgi:hypothetical protein
MLFSISVFSRVTWSPMLVYGPMWAFGPISQCSPITTGPRTRALLIKMGVNIQVV